MPEKRAPGPEESLRRGTIMVFAGIGLAIAYFVLHTSTRSGPPAWLFGVSGALVGLTGVGISSTRDSRGTATREPTQTAPTRVSRNALWCCSGGDGA